jgi:multicomponent Na+:H+ antiporter subunit C
MTIPEIGCVFIALLGLLGVVLSRSLLMKIVGLDVMNTGVISFFVVLSSRSGNNVPILIEGVSVYAHPVPQAVIVTAIVIGFAILAISLVYAMILVQRLRSVDTERLERESGE